jgi:hypothetical protein
MYPLSYVSTSKNVRGGHKNPKFAKKAKNKRQKSQISQIVPKTASSATLEAFATSKAYLASLICHITSAFCVVIM